MIKPCQAAVVRDQGSLKIKINGTLYPTFAFKSFRPNANNIAEFYAVGVRLFQILSTGITCALGVPYSLFGESWLGDGTYDFSAIDRQIDLFAANAPEAYFGVMLQLDTRGWYLKEHPGTPNSFTHLSQIAADETWKTAAAAYLTAAMRHIEEKYGDRVYAYYLLCGTTTEWFSDGDYETPNDLKNEGFRAWLGDGTAHLPTKERMEEDGRVFLNETETDVYIARKYQGEVIADLILYFVSAARSVIGHQKLLGLYYGYLLELGAPRLYNAGCLGYEKVYRCPDIDLISSPSSYGLRGADDPSGFMVTQKTLDRRNKICYLEFDHITHVAPSRITEGVDETAANTRTFDIPGADRRCRDLTETLNLMYRDFLLCQANGAALWWFDMFDGWFRSDDMMAAVASIVRIGKELAAFDRESIAEVAVFAEGESLYRTRKTAPLADQSLSAMRRTLAECGAPYDLFSITDLSPETVKKYSFFIFLDQYDLTEEHRTLIETCLKQEGKTLLWLYAPDYAANGCPRVGNIEKITGITVSESKTPHGGWQYRGQSVPYPLTAPYFAIEESTAQPVAYFEDGHVAVARKQAADHTSIYAATPFLPSRLLRDLLKDSGIHLYSEQKQVYTYVNAATVGVYNASGEDAVLHLLRDGDYYDYISKETFSCQNGILVLPKKDIRAYLLRRI